MPFEMVPKQTIDVENACKLLDIYEKYSDVINSLNNFINESERFQTVSEDILGTLYHIKSDFYDNDDQLWLFINDYIDKKDIRNVVYRKRL